MSSMEMMCLPITPNHVRLIIGCYPPAPLAAGPQFRPNSQELSRLTYYASNRPGKLHKLSAELEKRAKNQARRAQNGNAKARALLLVTLDIFKSLTAECRRDLSLFSEAVLNTVMTALVSVPSDLEVVARTASLFTAWATYTDGSLVGVDENLTRTYIQALTFFERLAIFEKDNGDDEFRNRTRLVGLAALGSAIQSDALFNSMAIFPRQVKIIVPALLRTIEQAGLPLLGAEATAVDTYSGAMTASPYMSEFQPHRPIAERRARSIHIHVDGEKGPSFSDVVNASLRAFQSLLNHSSAIQIPLVLEAAFNAFDEHGEQGGWENKDLCCWLVSKITGWTQYQYRYAIPSRLLERLVDARDAPKPLPLHFALASMITAVFTSPTPLINLSTSDILANLINIMMTRLSIDPFDALIPCLVEATASLGTHIYYADQIQDLVEELVSRLVSIQVSGLLGRGRAGNEKGREEGMRCLIACLDGLFRVADKFHPEDGTTAATPISALAEKLSLRPSSPTRTVDTAETLARNGRGQQGRRSKVAPEVWHDTVALLCEAEYSVRHDYAIALVHFLSEEIVKEPLAFGSIGSDVDSISSSTTITRQLELSKRLERGAQEKLPVSDSTIRFLHALHAAAFTLAVSPSLGLMSNSPATSSHSSSVAAIVPPAVINVIAPTPNDTPKGENPPEQPARRSSGSSGERPEQPPPVVRKASTSFPRRTTPTPGARSRTVSLPLSLLDSPPTTMGGVSPSPATPSDYSHLLRVLVAAHENLPLRALVTGVPMLLAMENATKVVDGNWDADDTTLQRKQALKEVVIKVWLTLSKVWECKELEHLVQDALSTASSSLPPVPPPSSAFFEPPTKANPFVKGLAKFDFETSADFDSLAAVELLSQSLNVQKALGLNAEAIKKRLTAPWSTEIAIDDSVEKAMMPDHREPSHFLKISPVLMHIDNKSLASLARTTRGVGVGDLREALEGRASMSNPALVSAAPSVHSDLDRDRNKPETMSQLLNSNLGRSATAVGRQGRKVSKGKPAEVRDVLNKLGIGKQNGSNLLHTPFPRGLKDGSETSPSILVPPYKQ